MSLTLFNIGVWGASGGGSFWPQWPALAFAIALADPGERRRSVTAPTQRQMSERIDVLTSTRAGAVDAQEEKLRRIERDLHDGAQARLVALGMSLGMAEQKLDAAEPGEARELLAEARAGAEHALRELRDLARGIHPPVLADRGLEAAVRSLADLSPLQVSMSVDLGERPQRGGRERRLLRLRRGARQRRQARPCHTRGDPHRAPRELAAHGDHRRRRRRCRPPRAAACAGCVAGCRRLDGTFRVVSPPGGPTVLIAELPCA